MCGASHDPKIHSRASDRAGGGATGGGDEASSGAADEAQADRLRDAARGRVEEGSVPAAEDQNDLRGSERGDPERIGECAGGSGEAGGERARDQGTEDAGMSVKEVLVTARGANRVAL